jgi:hypothetical protein
MTVQPGLVARACLLAAPLLQAASTFFWRDGYQGVNAGALILLASVCWVVGLSGLYRALESQAPRFSAIAWPVAAYGCLGGASFGIQGLCEQLMGVDHSEAVRRLEAYPAAAFVAFWVAGPLFPLSVLALGIALTRTRMVPAAVGILLCLGAVSFPLSRIPRESLVAHAADLLLLVPFAWLAFRRSSDP